MFWKFVKGAVAAAITAIGLTGGTAVAQTADVIREVTQLPPVTGESRPTIVPVPEGPQATLSGIPMNGCNSCGGSGGSCTDCMNGPVGCGEGGCYPGGGCQPICGNGPFTRLYAAFHNALCCPDPCYIPQWKCPANAAFFVDHARPTTMTRIRWDYGRRLTDPDRAEYFWAQTGGTGPRNFEPRLDYNELNLYQEVGVDKFSMFINLPYRSLNGDANGGSGGIGDLQIGTKSMLLDSELIQTTFQFVTTIPTAGPGGGIGTGHVALDPSLLLAVKLRENTYWQSQLGYWFGVGNSNGSVLHYHNAINQVLWKPTNDTMLVGTFEGVGYSFMSGTVAAVGPGGAPIQVRGNDVTYFTLGPGIRWCMCGKLDIGFGMQFAVTDRHFAEQLYRTEIRFRF